MRSKIIPGPSQQVAEFMGSAIPVSVKDNNGDLLSEDNGFLDEAFSNEWEIVR